MVCTWPRYKWTQLRSSQTRVQRVAAAAAVASTWAPAGLLNLRGQNRSPFLKPPFQDWKVSLPPPPLNLCRPCRGHPTARRNPTSGRRPPSGNAACCCYCCIPREQRTWRARLMSSRRCTRRASHDGRSTRVRPILDRVELGASRQAKQAGSPCPPHVRETGTSLLRPDKREKRGGGPAPAPRARWKEGGSLLLTGGGSAASLRPPERNADLVGSPTRLPPPAAASSSSRRREERPATHLPS